MAACSSTFCSAGLGVWFGSGKPLVIGGEDYCRVTCTEYSGTRRKVTLEGTGRMEAGFSVVPTMRRLDVGYRFRHRILLTLHLRSYTPLSTMYHQPAGISRSPTPACQAQKQKIRGPNTFHSWRYRISVGSADMHGGASGSGSPEGTRPGGAGVEIADAKYIPLSALPAAFCGGARTFVRRRTRPPDWGSGGKRRTGGDGLWSSGNFVQWGPLDCVTSQFLGHRCALWKLTPLYVPCGLTRRVSFRLMPRMAPFPVSCPLGRQARHYSGN